MVSCCAICLRAVSARFQARLWFPIPDGAPQRHCLEDAPGLAVSGQRPYWLGQRLDELFGLGSWLRREAFLGVAQVVAFLGAVGDAGVDRGVAVEYARSNDDRFALALPDGRHNGIAVVVGVGTSCYGSLHRPCSFCEHSSPGPSWYDGQGFCIRLS